MQTTEEILIRASVAFDEYDAAKIMLQGAEARISNLCREYSLSEKTWGFAPHMLRNAVKACLGKKRA
tara:strand:+ start:2538 stop:2738 length:201 start_codon:yes stop_codon:yes gene_type:complete